MNYKKPNIIQEVITKTLKWPVWKVQVVCGKNNNELIDNMIF